VAPPLAQPLRGQHLPCPTPPWPCPLPPCRRYAKANQTATDAFSSIRIIQAYGLQRTITRLYNSLMAPADAQMQKNSHYTGLGAGGGGHWAALGWGTAQQEGPGTKGRVGVALPVILPVRPSQMTPFLSPSHHSSSHPP
jgi:hypothetical protein